jgi:hypothetical protein
MAQLVDGQPFIAEAGVLPRASQCGVCGRQNGTGTNFFSKYVGIPLSVSLHQCSSPLHLNICSLCVTAGVFKHSSAGVSALLALHAACVGSCLPTFRKGLSDLS